MPFTNSISQLPVSQTLISQSTSYIKEHSFDTFRISQSGEPGLVDRVLALHAGSRGFDSQWGHMTERFFRSNRPGYPHPVSSELENSGIRVAVCDCSVTERWRWLRLIKLAKLCMCMQNTTNTTRTDARHQV